VSDVHLISPTGHDIRGTYERLTGTYPVHFNDERAEFDYTGGSSEFFDEDAKVIEIDGAATFLDENGDEWLAHHLIPADMDPLSSATLDLIAEEMVIGDALESAKRLHQDLGFIAEGNPVRAYIDASSAVEALETAYREAKSKVCTAIAVERGEQFKLALTDA
jgi:hypothetical protein